LSTNELVPPMPLYGFFASCTAGRQSPVKRWHALLSWFTLILLCSTCCGTGHHPECEYGSCAYPDAVLLQTSPKQQTLLKTRATSETSASNAVGAAEKIRKADRLGGRSKRLAAAERQRHAVASDGVTVVIPGLGNEERAVQVEKNLQWLKTQHVPFDCWIFIYRSEEEFPLNATRFEPCELVRHPGFWMSHLLAMPLNMTTKPFVLHLMDGIEPQPDVDLAMMVKTMSANGLGHASPTFDLQKSPNPYVESVYPTMARQENVSVGRFVDFIEMHINLFSREYFACLQDNIDTDNLFGWGMDRLIPALCGGATGGSEVEAGRMGLMDQMTMVKRLHGSYDLDAALNSMRTFLGKHPDTPQPTFESLGELKAPPAQAIEHVPY